MSHWREFLEFAHIRCSVDLNLHLRKAVVAASAVVAAAAADNDDDVNHFRIIDWITQHLLELWGTSCNH